MPTFIKPNLVHVQAGSGSGGLVTAVVAVVAVAGAAVAAWRWLAEPHPALEITLYSIVVAGVVAGVATVALVLRREFRCVPMRQKAALDAAMCARTGQALKSAL